MQVQTEAGRATQEVITVLAQTFGSTAEQVWGILIKQAVVWGWMMAGLFAFCVALVVALYKFASVNEGSSWDRESREIVAVIAGIIVCIIGGAALSDAVSYLANPQFHALKWLLERLPS